MKSTRYPIKGYEGRYEITEDGEVYRVARKFTDVNGRLQTVTAKKMTSFIDHRSGYPVVVLSKVNGGRGTQFVHRLLALTFIPQPAGKMIVNHIDGNKLNNKLDNLEWTTYFENYEHAIRLSLMKPIGQNAVPLRNRCNGRRYRSIREAADEIQMKACYLSQILRGHKANNTCIEKII